MRRGTLANMKANMTKSSLSPGALLKVFGLIGGLFVIAIIGVCISPYLPFLGPPRSVSGSTIALEEKWDFAAPTQSIYLPLTTGDLVLIRALNSVVAIDADTGTNRWNYISGSRNIPDSLLFVNKDSVIFRPNNDWTMYAVGRDDGKLKWQLERAFSDGQITGAAVDDTRVYVFSGRQGFVWAYNLKDGTLAWRSQSLHTGFYNITPRGDKLILFNNGTMFVLDSDTGYLSTMRENTFQGGSPWIFDDQVYQAFRNKLVVRNINTGATEWDLNKEPLYLTVIGDRVYFSSRDKSLSAVNRNSGQLLWEKYLDAAPVSAVTNIDDKGYLMLANGVIVELDMETGNEIGRVVTTPASTSPYYSDKGLATDGTMLYATFGDSTILAFGK